MTTEGSAKVCCCSLAGTAACLRCGERSPWTYYSFPVPEQSYDSVVAAQIITAVKNYRDGEMDLFELLEFIEGKSRW